MSVFLDGYYNPYYNRDYRFNPSRNTDTFYPRVRNIDTYRFTPNSNPNIPYQQIPENQTFTVSSGAESIDKNCENNDCENNNCKYNNCEYNIENTNTNQQIEGKDFSLKETKSIEDKKPLLEYAK